MYIVHNHTTALPAYGISTTDSDLKIIVSFIEL